MGHRDPDSWPTAATAEDAHTQRPSQDPEPGRSAAGSLMSIQIRRSRPPRKRAPGDPAVAMEPEARAAATVEESLDPPVMDSPSHAPEPAAAAGGNAAAVGAAAARTRQRETITAYWTRLSAGRPYPSISDLDAELIAREWPNSILFRCRAGSNALKPDMSFLPRLDRNPAGLGRNTDNGQIALSPMMLQWLVSLAGDAARNQRPVEDTESFPSARRAIGYTAVALPLSTKRPEIDHVLCHVRQA